VTLIGSHTIYFLIINLFPKLCTGRLLMSFNGQNKYELISDLLKKNTPIQ